ncbi:MAG: D-glycero-beta-D-manno-heptose 1-phosphate adenylyltransferase [Flavobacteriales bacterium]|nr:D-glycero-beta-D-manno-heptose 1-phosphate adenylyltransferase [Flavobacteriales bacterium]
MKQLQIIQNKIVARDELSALLNRWRFKEQKIVFTNGCFDIIHRGHIEYLANASDLGHKLVIGLNTDASVQRQGKGKNRPLQDELSRATILAALHFVDLVVFFDEDTPLKLIESIQPDVLVKGADYAIEDIVGHEIVLQKGGEVKTISFIEGYSTSTIIEKAKTD